MGLAIFRLLFLVLIGIKVYCAPVAHVAFLLDKPDATFEADAGAPVALSVILRDLLRT